MIILCLSLTHRRPQHRSSKRLKIHEDKSLTTEQDGVEPVLVTMATLLIQKNDIQSNTHTGVVAMTTCRQ